jgi:hypothetical protein
MTSVSEKRLKFEFPDGWEASKFDEWSFYRKQYMKLGEAGIRCSKCDKDICCENCGTKKLAGAKGIDILAIDPDSICWQIEIKDYRLTRESNFVFLADEVALKVRDTLACLVAARLHSNDEEERRLANAGLRCKELRVVLHLELPRFTYSLQTLMARKANVVTRLRQLVKAIDPRPLVLDMHNMNGAFWSVTQVGKLPR